MSSTYRPNFCYDGIVSTVVSKPWGREVIFTSPDSLYTNKLISINHGCRFSLQYHNQKTETLTLISGQAELTLGPDKDHLSTQPMTLFEGVTIKAGEVHRVAAQTDCQIMEASTPEKGITYRLEDDYNRGNEVK